MKDAGLADSSLHVDPAPGLAATRQRVAAVLGSTAFALAPDARSLRLLGQDRRHHRIDPCLPEGLAALGTSRDRIHAFRRPGPPFDLCLEDSWSGWFLAPTLAAVPPGEALVLVHLDDHADLMPTLLVRDGAGDVSVPATGLGFAPGRAACWEAAIASGAVTIGSWLTALVAAGAGPEIHVRHLHPAGSPSHQPPRRLRAGTVRHAVLPGRSFVDATGDGAARGTWASHDDPATALADLPAGPLAVHVDLDYFVNDFNGNPGTLPLVPDRPAVLTRMDRIFDALRQTGRPVQSWIVATSPGFCSGRHWPWLLDALALRIGAP